MAKPLIFSAYWGGQPPQPIPGVRKAICAGPHIRTPKQMAEFGRDNNALVCFDYEPPGHTPAMLIAALAEARAVEPSLSYGNFHTPHAGPWGAPVASHLDYASAEANHYGDYEDLARFPQWCRGIDARIADAKSFGLGETYLFSCGHYQGLAGRGWGWIKPQWMTRYWDWITHPDRGVTGIIVFGGQREVGGGKWEEIPYNAGDLIWALMEEATQ